jgi:STE24 endopeptidase
MLRALGLFIWTACLLLTLVVEAVAQSPEPTVVLDVPAGAQAGPDFDPEAATRAYLGLVSPEEREQSDAYSEGGYWLQLWGLLYGLGVAWLLLGTRLSARMRDLSVRITRRLPLQTALYAIQYVVITAILVFPLTWYEGFFREHQYDFAMQSFGPWFGDQAKGLLVAVIFGALAMMLVYAAIRRMPNRWWIGGTAAAMSVVILLSTVFPVYIAPLFNDYQELEAGPTRDSILSLARANGIPADKVYWFDASRQTTRISANVSGMLGTMRISLNDNLLNGASPEEIESVMAHEMGHYVLNHVWERIIYISLVLVFGFAFVKWAFDRALARWGRNWGVTGVADTAGLPLLIALFSIYFFFMTPVVNGIVRGNETEADIFALNASRQPDGFARVAMRISDYRKLEPGPLEALIFNHHPSGHARVHMSMQWKAEHIGEEEP